MKINILYEDSDILVCEKPVGMDSQDSQGFTISLTDELKTYLARQAPKGGIPYLGVIHRLDRPVGGVMVYAKTKKAAANLSKQVAKRQFSKQYYAVVCGIPPAGSASLTDYLIHDRKTNCSYVADASAPDAKKAELSYQVLSSVQKDGAPLTLVDVHLLTGRHHQIRIQFAHAHLPLYQDNRYNESLKQEPRASRKPQDDIGLFAYHLSFAHPVSGKNMEFTLKPKHGIFLLFQDVIS